MKELFGTLPGGQQTFLYTISCGGITALVSDYGATLVRLLVPDGAGHVDDVVLGYDDPAGYAAATTYLGATVGRNANRIGGSSFKLGSTEYKLTPNENGNNLHSGPDCFHTRVWTVVRHTGNSIQLRLDSPDGDQGYPGNAVIFVKYTLDCSGTLAITYDAVSDKDTVFNLTNHSYFNLAGHEKTAKAMEQVLTIPGRIFNPDDAESIPTGEKRSVAGSPMDFRVPKAIGREIDEDYDALNLQGGYDHNYEVFCQPCAIVQDPGSGREMAVYTDCPGVQFYAGNYLNDQGKDGVFYHKRSGICLETQFWPDALHHPEWAQPVTKAGKRYHSETVYRFSW